MLMLKLKLNVQLLKHGILRESKFTMSCQSFPEDSETGD